MKTNTKICPYCEAYFFYTEKDLDPEYWIDEKSYWFYVSMYCPLCERLITLVELENEF